MKKKSQEDEFIVLIIGEKNVGKTSIFNRICENKFTEEYSPSTFPSLRIKVSQNIIINIWDSGGENNRKERRKQFSEGIDGIIIVFDLTNLETFLTLDKWLKEIKEFENLKKAVIIIVGNKSDLKLQRQVQTNTILDFFEKTRKIIIETSAKENKKLELLESTLIKRLKNCRNANIQIFKSFQENNLKQDNLANILEDQKTPLKDNQESKKIQENKTKNAYPKVDSKERSISIFEVEIIFGPRSNKFFVDSNDSIEYLENIACLFFKINMNSFIYLADKNQQKILPYRKISDLTYLGDHPVIYLKKDDDLFMKSIIQEYKDFLPNSISIEEKFQIASSNQKPPIKRKEKVKKLEFEKDSKIENLKSQEGLSKFNDNSQMKASLKKFCRNFEGNQTNNFQYSSKHNKISNIEKASNIRDISSRKDPRSINKLKQIFERKPSANILLPFSFNYDPISSGQMINKSQDLHTEVNTRKSDLVENNSNKIGSDKREISKKDLSFNTGLNNNNEIKNNIKNQEKQNKIYPKNSDTLAHDLKKIKLDKNNRIIKERIQNEVEKIQKKIIKLENEFENNYICPICQQIWTEPVNISDGFTYDKTCILNWFKKSNLSPLTGKALSTKNITPNKFAQNLIKEKKEKIKQLQEKLKKIDN